MADTEDTTMADLIQRSSLGREDAVGLASLTSPAVVAEVLSGAASSTSQGAQTSAQRADATAPIHLPRRPSPRRGRYFTAAAVILLTVALGYTGHQAARTDPTWLAIDEDTHTLVTEHDNANSVSAHESQIATSTSRATNDTETGSVTTYPSPAPPSPAAPTPAASQVLRETGDAPLSFTWGHSVDLDSTAVNWDLRQGHTSDQDLSVSSRGRVDAGEVTLMDHVPTEAECRDATVRQPSLPDDMSVVGTMFCMTTDSGHRAFVHIVALDTEAEIASFDIVVWQ